MNQIDFVVQSVKGENRSFNQDYIEIFKLNSFYLFMIFDGVSSLSNSYDFIKNYVKKIKSKLSGLDCTKFDLERILYESHKDILLEGIEGMSTLSLLLISKSENISKFLSIGDSRIYIYNNQFIEKITIDDTLLSKKNELTKALGMKSLNLHDFCLTEVEKDVNFLICTDGFYNLMEQYLKPYFKALNYKNLKSIANRIYSYQNGKNMDDSSFILIKNVL